MKWHHRGFSLVEVLVATFVLAVALLGLLMLNQASGRGAMDAQFELLAFSLAQEPIEVFQNMGFRWVDEVAAGRISAPADYPLAWRPIQDPPFSSVQRPLDARLFQRHIALQPLPSGGQNAYRMIVTVAPAGQNRLATWITRGRISVEALIMERPR
jgi:prepilin-type N-terminal cleavage/methylation domain-containing protein